MLTLKGRTMIITGGAGNNGLAIIRRVLENGMNVGILSSTHAKAQAAVQKLGDEFKDQVMGWGQHPGSPENRGVYPEGATQADVLKMIYDRFGSIDVVVNGAGGHKHKNMEETDRDYWHRSMDLLEGAFFNIKFALPYLEKSKAPRVINLTTCEGRNGGYDFCPAFAAARGGLISLTTALAGELGPKGITVNCVVLGPIEGDVPEEDLMTEEKRALVLAKTPLGRLGVPEDAAGAVCFLASEEASFINGAVLDVNGGMITG
jgi:3-oxoacyl-[acyl-carrier protein] reductase